MSNQGQNPFKWRHFQADILLLGVHCYLRYLRELPRFGSTDGGTWIAGGSYHHFPAFVQQDAPELERRCRPYFQGQTILGVETGRTSQ